MNKCPGVLFEFGEIIEISRKGLIIVSMSTIIPSKKICRGNFFIDFSTLSFFERVNVENLADTASL